MVSSVVAVLMALTVVVDHYATQWFVTLHQQTSLFKVSPTIHGWQLATMLMSFVAFGFVFAWMVVHRYRLEALEERYEREGFETALQERRAEAVADGAGRPADLSVAAPAGVPPRATEGPHAGPVPSPAPRAELPTR